MKSILLGIIALTTLIFSNSAEEIFNKKCKSCHQGYIAESQLLINYEQNNSKLNLKAPTLTELSFALRDQVGDRKADRESQLMEIEDFLTSYLENPDKNRTILPLNVVENFKSMPSMRGQISEEEIELLAPYMFDYSEEMMAKYSVERYCYKKALKKAEAEGKIVLIEGYIKFCRGCIKMDREVFVEDRVKEALDKDFVFVKMNMLAQKLPFEMKSMGTPSFYFITNDGKKVIDKIQGIGTVDEFLGLLDEIKSNLKNGKYLIEKE